MRPTAQLHQLGQSLWLDNITRALLTSGTLKRYIDELSITGLTSNPAIFAGIPVNITLLFSREQYLAAADAYLRGLERRLDSGLSLAVTSVASLFISRWDVAVAERVPVEMHDLLGIAVAKQTYKAYRELIDSPRFGRLANAGARPQRLVWASTGTKDPAASDVLYLKALP